MRNRERAKELMIHYFSLIAREAGVNWDRDNYAEVADLADCLIDAAKEEMQTANKPSTFQQYLTEYGYTITEAARIFLSGFNTTEEAKEYCELFKGNNPIAFTPEGHPLTYQDMQQAIKIMEVSL